MINITIKNKNLRFETANSLFSPNSIDAGTLAMLAAVDFSPEDKVLDLGCGYGVVGILAAVIGAGDVVMSDSDPEAVKYARKNAALNGAENVKIVQSDGFKAIDDTGFTLILSNPPYHVDFNIPKHFIEKGFNRLCLGGRMVMVTKRLDWYKNKFTAIFGGVRVQNSGGYFVFIAEKRSNHYANAEARGGKHEKRESSRQ